MEGPLQFGLETDSYSSIIYVLAAMRSVACDSSAMPKVTYEICNGNNTQKLCRF